MFLEGEHADPGVAVVPPGVKVERKSWVGLASGKRREKGKHDPFHAFYARLAV